MHSIGALTVLGLAVALAMDAFAVAVGVGLSLGAPSARQTFRLSFHFGLFQFLMPIVGFAAGSGAERYVAPVDHWLAFGLLAFVGGRMVHESLAGTSERPRGDPTRGGSLVILSVATSLDALAVGLSLAFLGVSVWFPAAVIGVVACALTAAGLHLGHRIGARSGKRVGLLGGLLLIGIGVKILVEHLSQ